MECHVGIDSMEAGAPDETPSGRRLELLLSTLGTRFWILLACFLHAEPRTRIRCIEQGGEERGRVSIVGVYIGRRSGDSPGGRGVEVVCLRR